MKMVVFGSRTLTDDRVNTIIKQAIDKHKPEMIITSGETSGVCEIARLEARLNAIPLLCKYADNNKYAAGKYEKRAKAILIEADLVINKRKSNDMPNPENVIGKGNRWKKGESGNPKGRPKIPDLREAMSRLLAEEKGDLNALDAILKALFKRALSGDVRAAQELLDRGYGKAQQTIAHSGELAILQPAKFVIDEGSQDAPEADRSPAGAYRSKV